MTAVRERVVWRSLTEVPASWPGCVVTIGVFDGVHRGHAHLIATAREVAGDRPVVLVTFDPHPARVLGLPRDTSALSTVSRRAELGHLLGVEAVLVLPFTPALAAVTPASFVADVLVGALHAEAVVVGANFTFGHRGAGTVQTLRDLGLPAVGVELVHGCSSTRVHELVRSGDVRAAALLLGRPHRVEGVRATGVIAVPPGTALPPDGRYTGTVDGHAVQLVVAAGTVLATGPDGPAAVEFADRFTTA
ncbi:adenylyltransferase/cytidyltransferase family protein [Lentzea sp. HUAS12]|uniref:adenylyltransferase/cytidyltransferase family protein n=1 Tax=Lentzea sp. HUAS12 TaxID=2951806 RepID=UPI00209CF778|nr:adenylyltransferase/cytidyltransferase family protein [Lentzea sp. HUAS12]USX53059.1 adenylyltransferase/cytidyltransferase family protein [Lentzea sp. HUAS12]